MAVPIVYRWDDVDAPIARGERRSLCDILYTCLVTGYGDKVAAGWTREYINATSDKAVFRNNPVAGTGRYLCIDGLGGITAYNPYIMAYEIMTSIDDGLFPFNATQQKAWTSTSANTTAHPWILIADDLFFYFFCWPSITTTPTSTDTSTYSMAFGDPILFKADDAYACLLMAGDAAFRGPIGFLNNPSTITTNTYTGLMSSRNYSGVASPVVSAAVRGGGPGAETYSGAHGIPWSSGDAILMSRPHINNAAAYTIRGWLPGYYYPCHPLTFGQFEEVNTDGKTFLSLRHMVFNSAGNSFILLSDWRV